MIDINTIDANDMLIEAELDETVFYIRLSWNSTGNFWTLGLQNSEGTILVSGIAVVPDFGLLRQFRRQMMPLGDLVVYTGGTLSAIGRDAFLDGTAGLVYVEEQDLIDAGLLGIYGKL